MTENSPKLAKKFYCECCDYRCSKQSDYNKHILTMKHKNNYTMAQNNDNLSPKVAKKYVCDCGKEYKYRQGIYAHRKTCDKTYTHSNDINDANHINDDNDANDDNISDNDDYDNDNDNNYDNDYETVKQDKNKVLKNIVLEVISQTSNNNNNSNNELIQYLINENKEFKNLILEIVKKDTIINNNNNNNTINNNCNNKSFNLNFFLNEQCKDAMNINEFVDSIKMNLSDLEEFEYLDYADGVSNIFVKGINALGVHLRPIHCSDAKREVLYIKNNNEWVKETDDKQLIKSAIKKVAFKNIRQINEWVKENPTCKDPTTKKFDQYNRIVMNAMSGVTEQEQKDNIEKIVRNVTKAVTIDKYTLK